MVPARSLELTPMDGCYVRMGARDAILAGQSTFFIEMAETAAMLGRASSRSLVALDELGRGTATLDGEGAGLRGTVYGHVGRQGGLLLHPCGAALVGAACAVWVTLSFLHMLLVP